MLDREEYIEQAHLFRALAEQIAGGGSTQEALLSIGQEVLATSKLPMAIDYMVGELKLVGTLSTAMSRLPHYFTAFQTFIMHQAEQEGGRFDLRTGLAILEREAAYRGEGAMTDGSRGEGSSCCCDGGLVFALVTDAARGDGFG